MDILSSLNGSGPSPRIRISASDPSLAAPSPSPTPPAFIKPNTAKLESTTALTYISAPLANTSSILSRSGRKLRKDAISSALADMSAELITGSIDLSGVEKSKIPHYRNEMADEDGVLDAFSVGEKLGQGSFGTVFLVVEKVTGIKFACKTIKKPRKGEPKMYEQLQREIALMKTVNHPYIIRLYQVFETPKKYSMIMEYCAGGDLTKFLRSRKKLVTEQEGQIIISRLTAAVAYLHMHGVVHRDIKPENILLSTENPPDPFNIRISDFGLAAFTNKPLVHMENIAGTPMYMAPEIIQNLGYSAMCDVWSIGVMMWLFMTGFARETEMELLGMITSGRIEYPPVYWKDISPAARRLTEALLKFDPAKRMSSNELILHPWIQGRTPSIPENGSSGKSYTKNTVLDLMRLYKMEMAKRRAFVAVMVLVRFMAPVKKQRKAMKQEDLMGSTSSVLSCSKIEVGSRGDGKYGKASKVSSKRGSFSGLSNTYMPEEFELLSLKSGKHHPSNSVVMERISRPPSSGQLSTSALPTPKERGSVTTNSVTSTIVLKKKAMGSGSSMLAASFSSRRPSKPMTPGGSMQLPSIHNGGSSSSGK